jgi:hypothetical protein
MVQDVQFIDPATQESLASRVCRGDASLIQSEQQTSAYETLSLYLNEDGEGYGGTGFLAAGLCIFMWINVVAKEAGIIYDKIAAMCAAIGVERNLKISTLFVHTTRAYTLGSSSPRKH